MDKYNLIIAIAEIIVAIFAVLMFILAVYSFLRTLKENWRNSVRIAASDYIGKLESLRMKRIYEKIEKESEDSKKSEDSKQLEIILLGEVISVLSRLKILLSNKKEYNNIIAIAEKLRNMADKGELLTNEYEKIAKDFEMACSI